MWTRLNAWIMSAGDASRIDDNDGWVVFITDARGVSFSWKGIDYTAGLAAGAPGYADFELPPGTYVVWAERTTDERTVRTHSAVVAVHAEPLLPVRLLPDPSGKPPKESPERPAEDECRIAIHAITGDVPEGEDLPRVIGVEGEAQGCAELQVTVRGGDGQHHHTEHVVAEAGHWTLSFANELQARCGELLLVEAVCLENRTCSERIQLRVRCRTVGDQLRARKRLPKC